MAMDENKKAISKTIDFIENHLNDKLKLDHISNKIGYSKFYLNRLFQEEVGLTIHKYIKKRRLEEAAKRLKDSEDSISDIAYDANYESLQAFTYAFKKMYQYPPKIYRKLGVFEYRKDKFKFYDKIIKNGVNAA